MKTRIDLPGGWYLVMDTDKNNYYREWFLSRPDDVWVAKFWEGPFAGRADVIAFAQSLGVSVDEDEI